MPSAIDLSTLNEQQREAVEWPGGPLLVFAGAGSGKTRVITHRIARLIEKGVHPARILAVTFTNKAAREMRERIASLLGGEARSVWLGTFHSICARILRMEGRAIGLDPNFTIYDDDDQISLVREIFKEHVLNESNIQPRAVLNEISRAKERLWTPADYDREAVEFFERIVAQVYADYQKRLTKANALDFDDILMLMVRLLDESAETREKLQERFLHVLIDEYQDVNLAQYKFADTISKKHGNLTIVGDDDQSIYSWRGADVSLMLRFTADHPDAKVVTLSQNYRSTQRILEAANAVIVHNSSRAAKQLWTDNDPGPAITISEAGTERDEAMMIVDRVIRDTRSGRRAYGDFAILYRTNSQSRVMEEAFVMMRIPYLLVGAVRFYERKEVKDIVAYLRLIQNPLDDVSFRRVVNVPARGLGATSLAALQGWARRRDLSLWDAAQDQEVQGSLGKKPLYGLKHFLGIVEEGREIAKDGLVTPIVRHIFARTGYLDELRKEGTEEAFARLDNLEELISSTSEYDQDASSEATLAGYLENVALMSDQDTLRENGKAVTLMTLHSAKGLEFPVVFLAGLEEGVFPHSRSAHDQAELEEERRLCYVGMTRAREELHLTYARRRTLYGQPNFNLPSRFVENVFHLADGALTVAAMPEGRATAAVRVDRTGRYSAPETAAPLRSPEWEAPFKVGVKVNHAKFGIGVVIACAPLKGDVEVTVQFMGAAGLKKLVQSLAKLEAL
ncbi:MAG TPA: UvrD-helicase domain-containing protein [Fimbriimonadaceae bacterium]|nr:UvrD-helicase domain-containing protein [Fimbriimonadaceae bacterium]